MAEVNVFTCMLCYNCLLVALRSWVQSVSSWFWSWYQACWTVHQIPTCCQGTGLPLTWRSPWSLAWRRGLSTTGYHSSHRETAKPLVKTSSGKPSPLANSGRDAQLSYLPTYLPTYVVLPGWCSAPNPTCETQRESMNCGRPQLYISCTLVWASNLNGPHWHSLSCLIIDDLPMYLSIYVCISLFKVQSK